MSIFLYQRSLEPPMRERSVPRFPTVWLCVPVISIVLLVLCIGGCKDVTGSPGLPSGTADPSFYNNKAGALGMRSAAIFAFQQELPSYLIDTGLLTDELEDPNTGASAGQLLQATGVADPLDERILPEGSVDRADADYGNLQGVRGIGNQALGALATYDTAAADTATAKMYRGELYALEGYSEVLIADLFCSGVPLSTLDYAKDFTYQPSSSTEQVYKAAAAKFDTALTLADTSTLVLNLARVGRGRALLNLGQFAAAAMAVASVPDGFSYQIDVNWQFDPLNGNVLNFFATVSDHEGGDGVSFLSSGDPRSAVDITASVGQNGVPLPVTLTFPKKYMLGSTPFPVADWIEARLIQAEAALQANPTDPTWLTILNHLRKTAMVPGQTAPLDTVRDPGTSPDDSARVSLLFRERAEWLFLTGHRQGDLRRLIHVYGRHPEQVYPSGKYLAPGVGVYGTDINAPIPNAEAANPLFHGCLSRDDD